VLEATTELLAELTPEEVTTALIAERAGVSVAWIYRYFANRQAIFDSIVLDAVHRLFERTQLAALAAVEGDWRDGVRAVLHANVEFFAQEPAFGRLWSSEFRSSKMLTANRLHDDDQAAWLYETMTGAGVLHPGPATRRACQLVVAFSDRGLELAFTHDDRGDPIIVKQLGAALVAVLEPFVTDAAADNRRNRRRTDP
jgi:AcrR family transcriptional regulator